MKNSTLIIAEVGVNHNGCIKTAHKLILEAKKSGADYVKFQTFQTEALVTEKAPLANYQKKNNENKKNQFKLLKSLELSEKDHIKLKNYCNRIGIKFISSPFDENSLNFLTENLKLNTLKIPSGEITNTPFLRKIGSKKTKIILSTGMANFEEINIALGALIFGFYNLNDTHSKSNFKKIVRSDKGKFYIKKYVHILHCTSEYPAPFEEINLNCIKSMIKKFGENIGFSDHSEGIEVAIAAVSLGAKVIEKHFTLDKNMKGPDHKASIDSKELTYMVSAIRNVEKSFGISDKKITNSEKLNFKLVRKSIFASKHIKKGHVFDRSNICIKRPIAYMEPNSFWSLIGKKSTKQYSEGDPINE
tara:strand:+ start:115 stop:1194 length:1080 start_codon:yes stop_codon:yes gene_type:complete